MSTINAFHGEPYPGYFKTFDQTEAEKFWDNYQSSITVNPCDLIKEALFFDYNESNYITPNSCEDKKIVIYNTNPYEPIVTLNLDTGKTEFGPNYSFDKASEVFWTALGKESPVFLREENKKLREELNKYKKVEEKIKIASHKMNESSEEILEKIRKRNQEAAVNKVLNNGPFDNIPNLKLPIEEDQKYLAKKYLAKKYWENFLNELVNVQPITAPAGEIFTMKPIPSESISEPEPSPTNKKYDAHTLVINNKPDCNMIENYDRAKKRVENM